MRRYEMAPLLPRFMHPSEELVPGAARVTTDGSCQTGGRAALGLSTSRGPGGWCAIVEHGSEGHVLRGRVPETTATRMEMLAVVEGLRALPSGCHALVVTDALIVQHVHEAWRRGDRGPERAREKDIELWKALHAEFSRVGRLRFRYVKKRDADSAHLRCHKFAGAEAKALALELGQMTAKIPDGPIQDALAREEEKLRRRELLAQFREDDRRRRDQVVRARSGDALERQEAAD